MSSEVAICNLALSHIGDTAVVSSIDPPEGSAQSEHCARFYPIARDALQELHAWGFCTTRAPLALLSLSTPQWQFVYSAPNGVIMYIDVIPPDAQDDYSQGGPYPADSVGLSVPCIVPVAGSYVPQRFQVETLDGQDVVLTNQPNAVLRYTRKVTDSSKFSALFTLALSHLLASMLAGPVIKGDAGKAEAKAQMQLFQAALSKAVSSDAGDRNIKPTQLVPWMSGR